MTNPNSDFFFGAAEPERDETEQPESQQSESQETEPQQPEPRQSESGAQAPTDSASSTPEEDSSTDEPSDEATPQTSETPSADVSNADIVRMSWDEALPVLRQRFPKASDGILFCVQKLLLDTELALPQIRGEAELHNLKIGGRSVHSAKVLLGLAEKSVRRKKVVEPEVTETEVEVEAQPTITRRPRAKAATTPSRAAPSSAAPSTATDTLVAAIQQIQDGAREEAEQLRAAMRDAIQILTDALGED